MRLPVQRVADDPEAPDPGPVIGWLSRVLGCVRVSGLASFCDV